MSIRIVVACLLTLGLCTGASAPPVTGAVGFASVSLAPTPDRVLVCSGEASAAFDFFRGRRAERSPEEISFESRLLAELGRFAEAESVLAEHPPLGDDPAVALHYLRRAALDLLAERYARALDAVAMVDSSAGGIAGLDAYRDYIAMRADLALGRADEAVHIGESVRARGLPEALEQAVGEAMVDALEASGDASAAVALARELQGKTGSSDRRADLLYREFELYANHDRTDDARRVALELVNGYALYPNTTGVADEILSGVAAGDMTLGELVAYTGYCMRSGRSRDAGRLLDEMGSRDLGPDAKEQQRLLRADYHYRTGGYAKAIALAKATYTNPSYRRQSILILARAYRRSDREREAAALYEYFARAYPNDEKTAEALFVAAHIYDRLDDGAAEDRVLDVLMKSYPSSYYGHAAALMAADHHTRRGEHVEAVEVLSRLSRRARGNDEAALYYLSQAYESTGDRPNSELILSQLQTLDPNSFYLHPAVPEGGRGPMLGSSGALTLDGEDGLFEFIGRGARERNDAYRRIHTELAPPAEAGDAGFGAEDYNACLARGRWFLEAGLREWGEAELDAARRRCYDSPGRTLELARVYDEYAMPWRSVQLYQRARDRMPWKRRGDFAQDFQWLLYPTPYPLQVLQNAERYGVSPHLAFAMIREESRFDVGAVSRVGALGLMQIMPETGRWVASELELPGWVESDLLNPEINVAFGVWYASTLLREGNGNPLWMLAAYNAGPGNARRWFDGTGEANAIRTVDGIDFRETRQYVQRIVESANIYHSLYFAARDGGGSR